MSSLKYTNIQHGFRKHYGLTCNEYVLADMVYFLSTNPDAKIKGWCFKSKNEMADDLGVTKQTILNILKSLQEKGFIDKDPNTSFLKSTPLWNSVYFTSGKESIPHGGKETLPDSGKESIPNNNSLNNNIDNNNIITEKNSVYKDCMSLYNDFIICHTDLSAKIDSKSGVALKKIIKYFETQVKDKNDPKGVQKALEFVFQHHEYWEEFHQKQLTLNQIDSNLINILSSIRKAKQNGNIKKQSKPISRYAPVR